MLNSGPGGGEKQMVYVDDAEVQKHGYAWFHLMADSIQELHEFAVGIGLPARSFHRGALYPHYDVTAGQRRRALRHGAVAISARDAVQIGRRVAQPDRRAALDCSQLCLFS
ncbi:DUF4031 domain-containing protein [Rhodoferax sp. BAB1]|uniref:DUF4031 domain-containing protein n=1 Tax=Rhodoferax sp. BAB1 TaxID=2741720 RepID=UPI00352EC376